MTDLRDALGDLADHRSGRAPQRDLVHSAWRTARRRRQRRVLVGAAGAVVLLAGLAAGLGLRTGGGPSPAPPIAGAPHSTGPHSTGPSLGTPSQPASSPSGAVTRGGLTTFASPSGNITCLLDQQGATCDLAQFSWSPGTEPCGQAALAGLRLPAAGEPGFDCRTDVLVPDPQQVLGYGQVLTLGDITCSSATTGVTCRSRRTHHSIFVSRDSYLMN